MDLYKELCAIAGKDAVAVNEPMARHTTFRIGGPADWFVAPSGTEEVRDVIELCRQQAVPYYIIGNGSNLLVGDKGYRGVIIQVFRKMSGISTEGEMIRAQAGALLSKVAAAACSAGLTGISGRGTCHRSGTGIFRSPHAVCRQRHRTERPFLHGHGCGISPDSCDGGRAGSSRRGPSGAGRHPGEG